MPHTERSHQRHKLHIYILFVPAIVFIIFSLFTTLNHIYCGIIAMFLGGLATLYCRPDLKGKIWVGGILFTSVLSPICGAVLEPRKPNPYPYPGNPN